MMKHLLFLPAVVAVLQSSAAAWRSPRVLADPAEMLRTAERMDFAGANSFRVELGPHGRCLRSTPNQSASALYQSVDISEAALQGVSWSWRIDRLQRSADLRNMAREDVGATIMFVFGEPSVFNRDVPTLAYVWTSTPVANGVVLPSQRYRSLAYLQLRGRNDVGRWQEEQRDVPADFRAIYGREPGPLKYIAIFNDNDQTGEPISAVFGPVLSSR